MNPEEDKRNEKTGRAVFSIAYFMYALSVIVPSTLVAGAVLYFAGKPLRFAPLIGIAVWLIVRGVRILVFRIFYRLSKM
ncbi:MAG: hypothetical protein IKH65_09930 [Clostridia bacterium]|nr:hypothetical protein [Clostridia bacterium]